MGSAHCQPLKLKIASRGDKLAGVRSHVGEIAEACGFSKQSVYDIKVAVGEAVANAVEHGSPKGEINNVVIDFKCDKTDLTITVVDEGIFKRTIPGPSDMDNYRGHGILIMLALMDKVTINESAHGTSVLLAKCYRTDN
ncbi:MAG: ATP-binding protein [Actinomycetia bacterium]|nr:ATP-binding protein [Actinomycetes bacterium]